MKTKKHYAKINFVFNTISDTIGRVRLSTTRGTDLVTILFPIAVYNTKESATAMAENTLLNMLASGKISKKLLNQ